MESQLGPDAMSGFETAKALFDAENLFLPPIPEGYISNLSNLTDTLFSTLEDTPLSPYHYPDWLNNALAGTGNLGLTFGFAGYGLASTALHYYLLEEKFGVLLQVAWGGIHAEYASDIKERLQQDFRKIEAIRKNLADNHNHPQLIKGKRLLMAMSDLYQSGIGWVASGPDGHETDEWNETPFPLAVVQV